MKKLICIILTLTVIVCLAGCGGAQPAANNSNQGGQPVNAPTPVLDGCVFTYNGTKIPMHGDAAPIISALGNPQNYTEETSCAFTGLDKTYFYGSFYLQTYPIGDHNYVYTVWFADDNVATEEGVYIGMPQANVEEIYGAEAYNGTNAYILTKGKSRLSIILKDGLVSDITYEALTD